MSWFSQRWRTQRNAIRNVNCKTQWIIKILNANCAPRLALEHVPLSISSTNFECVAVWQAECGVRNLILVLATAGQSRQSCSACSALGYLLRRIDVAANWTWFWMARLCDAVPIHNVGSFTSVEISSLAGLVRCRVSVRQGWCVHLAVNGLNLSLNPISNGARRPAEFKHIIRRRKRN